MNEQEIESGRSVTEEEREDPTNAPRTGLTEDGYSAEETSQRGDPGPDAANEEDTEPKTPG
jgi:hypothetical protein